MIAPRSAIRRIRLLAALAATLIVLPAAAAADDGVDFATHIQPLLAEHCFECHGSESPEAGLDLTTLQGINAGGQSGRVIVPGAAAESLLVAAIRYADESLQMPPAGRLSDDAVSRIAQWVNEGAVHPDGTIDAQPLPPPFDPVEARQFWAFQPPEDVPIPDVVDPARVHTPVDAFVLAELDRAGIRPNPLADRRTLIRRATLDLTGLPPTPQEVKAFVEDPSPDAFARLVDRLLDSPAYGERWGRHWLDVVRYADSNGLDENIAHGNAWRYRDYVIRSFNEDRPVDQFLREQLAGDLLVRDDHTEAERNRLLVATGFLSLGPKVLAEGDEVKLHKDIVDEQIDTTGRAFLGLTLGCARCHDHKFDPISQADYYRLAGIFESTRTMESLSRIARWNENPLASRARQEAREAHQQKIDATEQAINRLLAPAPDDSKAGNGDSGAAGAPAQRNESELTSDESERLAELRRRLAELKDGMPAFETAMGVTDGEVRSSRILHRGSHLSPGRVVPRGIPAVLANVTLPPISEDESGRRQLAEWLTHPDHPLTARVFVNRVWRWHFGRGLVETPDNFGHRGESPHNSQLLDWLTQDFVRSGWSLGTLHRTLMLSATWRRSATQRSDAHAVDPDNRLWWRFPSRRLEAEAIRDSVLAVSGLLDRTMGGSLLHVGNREFLFNHTSQDETSYESYRRAVYLPVIRNNLYDGFSLFDYTDASVPNGDRSTSTVASQSLFLMNSDLLLESSVALAARTGESADGAARVQTLHEICLARPADESEVAACLAAVEDFTALLRAEGQPEDAAEAAAWDAVCQSMLMSTEFVYLP